jgi:uncharacterized protein (UPF0248 family)
MQPIQDLINKIKWDENEDPSEYVIGYEDRVLKKVIEIKYSDIKRIEDNFMVLDRDNEEVMIPLHRVRIVRKKDLVVWKRG